MRRKRRTKYTWLPTIGSVGNTETDDNFSTLNGFFGVTPIGDQEVSINPLVPDVPLEGDSLDTTQGGVLVQVIGQEYVIERIVGKCFLGTSAPADDPPTTIFPKIILIGCGIFVARANDAGVGGGVTTPIGSASPAERVENYSPLSEDTIRMPWMWRRTWILTTGRPNPNVAAANQPFGPVHQHGFVQPALGISPPTTNTQFGSVMDGPHFDVKSVRRVRQDERLWFVIATRALDTQFVSPAPNTALVPANGGGVGLILDFRVLGALRKARNKSSF